MKIYLAGPMRGFDDMNRPAFHAAAEKLRDAGHLVFNPADNEAGNLRANLATDTSWISLVADAVVFLPGWEKSLGATAEEALAVALGLDTWELDAFLSDDDTEMPQDGAQRDGEATESDGAGEEVSEAVSGSPGAPENGL